ncbi:MAG: glutamate--tRNA ligase, partial [Bacteroidetes bacterium]|nr:glutamate--tRNA ligase [Bacteroidota bacterium]
LMTEWLDELKNLNDFSSENIDHLFKQFISKKELGIGAVMPLFRLLLTGKGMGPGIFDIAEFLGKQTTIERLEAGLSALK